MIERLKRFIENKGLSVSAFEQSIGASDGMIRRAIKNGTDIQSKWLSVISDNYPDLSLDWLIADRGPMLRGEQSPVNIQYERDPRDIELIATQRMLIEALRQGLGSGGLGSARSVDYPSTTTGKHHRE